MTSNMPSQLQAHLNLQYIFKRRDVFYIVISALPS